ncbi:MAG: Glu/Leu/Phe/Val dehydrogenase [Patescibacteria group bacterium]|jgi:glutamate dehydrogenase/leucine dehydrogenase
MKTPFENFLVNLDKASQILGLSKEEASALHEPNKIIEKKISISMDSGEQKEFNAYRVQFNNARGPYKGGIRFHPEADIEEVKALAAGMAIKTAVVNIPLGGSKGGVECNPKDMSEGELEGIARAWARAMADDIGVDKDIPAPDVYTNPQIMAYMVDEYEKIKGHSELGVITGKPLELGGSQGRGSATARGGVYVLEELVNKLSAQGGPALGWGRNRTELRVAIQGYGNAGYHAASILYGLGYKIVAVSDSRGGIYDANGLNPEEVQKVKQERGSVVNMPGIQQISNEELIICDCDVLIPSALDNQIKEDNASDIKAKIILELANGPTAPEADKILIEKNVIIIPDVLANAGGVTVSYFEWVQNRTRFYWTEGEVLERLKPIMVKAFNDVWQMSREKGISLRDAAFILAIERIVKAMRFRGLKQ